MGPLNFYNNLDETKHYSTNKYFILTFNGIFQCKETKSMLMKIHCKVPNKLH
jgi:hypothetical protein